MSFINNAPNIDFENGKKIGYKQAKKETQKLIGKIMELHAPEKIFDDYYCSHCLEDFDHGTDQATYPCETVKIIITKEPR